MKSFSPKNEFCCHARDGVLNCFLEMLHKLQKPAWQVVGPAPVAFLKHLPILKICYINVTFEGVHLDLVNWFLLFILMRGLFVIRIACMPIQPFVTIPICYEDVYVEKKIFLAELHSRICSKIGFLKSGFLYDIIDDNINNIPIKR